MVVPHRAIVPPSTAAALLDQALKEEESAAEYRKGCYLPITIGDKFAKGRYSFSTLSWGHFSTVWLVKDEQ